MLAWIGLHDGQLFVQPADEASAVLHNGTPIAGSTWLRSGDVLDAGGGRLKLRLEQGGRVLELVAGGAGNPTAPPAAETTATVGGLAAGEDERIEPVAFRRPDAMRTPPPRTVPWRRLAMGAALALLIAIAAGIFTSVPVQVEISPAPERVAFEGGWRGLRFGTSHLLRPGSYTLVAEREGYAPLGVPVEITTDRNQRLSFTLEPLPGRLEVVLPVPGRVSIDGQPAGEAPGPFELASGRHTVIIDTERYLDATVEVEVEGLGRLQKTRARAHPRLGHGLDRFGARRRGTARGRRSARPDTGEPRSHGRVAPRGAAARRVQALGERRAGAGQRAAHARARAPRPAGRATGGAERAGWRQRHRRRRLPRSHAARDRRPSRRRAVGRGAARGLRAGEPAGERRPGRARGRRVQARADPGRGDRALDARGRADLRGRRGARRCRPGAAVAGDRARARGAHAGLRDPPRHGHAAARPSADPRGDSARGRDAGARREPGRRGDRGRVRRPVQPRPQPPSARSPPARSRRWFAARAGRSSSSCRQASSPWAARAARPVVAPTRRSVR